MCTANQKPLTFLMVILTVFKNTWSFLASITAGAGWTGHAHLAASECNDVTTSVPAGNAFFVNFLDHLVLHEQHFLPISFHGLVRMK